MCVCVIYVCMNECMYVCVCVNGMHLSIHISN